MIEKAILAINPDAKFIVINNDIDKIEWTEGTTPIAKDEIQTKVNELQADYDAKAYQRSRKLEYPDMGDQLDDLYKAGAFSDDMTAKIKAVKDKFPK